MPNVAFDSIPQEVLENIAFYAVASNPLGPPRELAPLLLVNRRLHAALSSASNPHLHARIFAAKFDTAALVRRLGPGKATARKMAAELRRRCVQLGRMRGGVGCTVGVTEEGMRALHEMLWTAYVMMLENDGRNERQLREYARLDGWLRAFWFAEDGASFARLEIGDNAWPPYNDLADVTMWLFWFLLKPEDYFALDDAEFRNVTSILKLLALGAHKYPVCRPAWLDFVPNHTLGRSALPPAYAEYPSFSPLPLTAPAVLSFLSLAPHKLMGADALQPLSPLVPSSVSPQICMSSEWDCEWERCKRLAGNDAPTPENPSGTFKPGTMEGVWEGLFTYTDFTAYREMLSGAPPPTLSNSVVAWHPQTWRLREYHLLLPEDLSDEAKMTAAIEHPRYKPLSPGDPLRAYLPQGLTVDHAPNGMNVYEPGRVADTFYQRCPAPEHVTAEYAKRIREILIAGEGHSAWGEFELIGRVRPGDGLVTLSKEYIDGDRGKWLYRGYYVGDAHGNFTGRWRDTLSPAEEAGYEGCFFMGRRRQWTPYRSNGS
ncbi:hypothetical protein DFH94DRAFT_621517 [Russula ochroleuca]|uniref:F-box domain-containing protein n=1 Tax=Russula ochroleuca TaxID=152965 RepID=A0A9P5N5B1_9AGAM|nr:hypothetical protein DFH94DRAFT_621517 [Russula ochroleuca]